MCVCASVYMCVQPHNMYMNLPFLHVHACSDVQLFGKRVTYSAVTEVQGESPEQLTVIQNQPVRVLDAKRKDWWLVSTIPDGEDALPPQEGWIRSDLLRLDSSIGQSMCACVHMQDQWMNCYLCMLIQLKNAVAIFKV